VPERTLVVTGSASGIGAAVAAALRADGAAVIGLDLGEDADVRCDLADPAAVDAALAALPAALDGLVNCAGVPGTHPPERILAVNLLGPRRLAAGLADRLSAGSAVVDVASIAALRSARSAEDLATVLGGSDDEAQRWLAAAGLDGTATYDFTKQALVALSLLRARDWLPRGIRSVSVSPGPTVTPILDDFTATMGADRMAAAERLVGRHGTPDDMAPVVVFLLGPGARWINGIDVRVDGGVIGARLAPEVTAPATPGGQT
jgi:NAD(P)-dependent dehydrogenase (short-subunit alcohol dehydrogenase family)